jgi:hypothetical protein
MCSNNPPRRKGTLPPYYERIMRIAQDHIHYAKRFPDRLTEIGKRMKISSETALALAITDEICEEFSLTERN